jgi:hypothetical protein
MGSTQLEAAPAKTLKLAFWVIGLPVADVSTA